jgi:hypothetical protein
MHGDGHARGYAHDNDHGHVHRRNSFAFPVHVAVHRALPLSLHTYPLDSRKKPIWISTFRHNAF